MYVTIKINKSMIREVCDKTVGDVIELSVPYDNTNIIEKNRVLAVLKERLGVAIRLSHNVEDDGVIYNINKIAKSLGFGSEWYTKEICKWLVK